MAFSNYGNSAYNPAYNRYAPFYGNQAAYGANNVLGQMPPVASPLPGTAPTQSFTPSPGAYGNSQTFGASGYPSNASYSSTANPPGIPNSPGYQQPYRMPTASYGYNTTATSFVPGRPISPAGYAPYSPTAYPYYHPPMLYAAQASLSQQAQRKKYWSKFILNTGSTLAGLSLAAYFGMKILPKAIVSEMGIQVKNNLLSRNTKAAMLKNKARELLADANTPQWIKDLIQKDLHGKPGQALSKWQKAKLEKVLLDKAESSEVASAFLRDSLTRTMADPQFKQSTANFMQTTFDDKFQREFSDKVIDSIQKSAQEKNIIGWLYQEAQQTLKKNGSWLSRFF